MSKKQSTLLAAIETTAAPADVDFVVDGDAAKVALQVFTLTGTGQSITATVTELIPKGFTLAFSDQTVNFALGEKVRGSVSGAEGRIMDQTDPGATGTLELKQVHGNFVQGEDLIAETGNGKVAGILTPVYATGSVWATITAATADQEQEFVNPARAIGESDRYHVYPRRFRLAITEVGTWTAARFAVDLIQSGV